MKRIFGAEMIALLLRGFDSKSRGLPELVNIGCGQQPGCALAALSSFSSEGSTNTLRSAWALSVLVQ